MKVKTAISLLLVAICIGVCSVRIYKKVVFKQEVTGYLKRAADANTISLADEELSRAIAYLEANNLTTGYTSVLYETPDEDIDFWYRNLKASQNELRTLHSESALERTNVLIKLRETLVDTGEKTKVTVPGGLDVYPHNKTWALLLTLSIIGGLSGFTYLMTVLDRHSKQANPGDPDQDTITGML